MCSGMTRDPHPNLFFLLGEPGVVLPWTNLSNIMQTLRVKSAPRYCIPEYCSRSRQLCLRTRVPDERP